VRTVPVATLAKVSGAAAARARLGGGAGPRRQPRTFATPQTSRGPFARGVMIVSQPTANAVPPGDSGCMADHLEGASP
jgi:hypothetical protein